MNEPYRSSPPPGKDDRKTTSGYDLSSFKAAPHPLAVAAFDGTRHGNAHLLAAVHVVQTRDAAIARVDIEGTEFAGTSKRAPGERHDPTSGGRLAIARALRAAAAAYERAAGVTPYAGATPRPLVEPPVAHPTPLASRLRVPYAGETSRPVVTAADLLLQLFRAGRGGQR